MFPDLPSNYTVILHYAEMIFFKYDVIIPVISHQKNVGVHSQQYHHHMLNLLFICNCHSGYWSVKLEYYSMMALVENETL